MGSHDEHPEVTIERGSAADIEALRDLWLELHHHHATVAPDTGEFTDDETSWRERSGSYREWLGQPDSFLLLARDEEGLCGYALIRVMAAGSEWTDTWVVGQRIAELETMLVLPRVRGRGLGTRLLDRIDDELERLGITDVVVGLIPGNDGAQRLYERRGFKPRWLVLGR